MTVFRTTELFLKNRLAVTLIIAGISANIIVSGITFIRLCLRNGLKDDVSLSEESLQPVRHALSEAPVAAVAYINEERSQDDASREKALFFVTYALAPYPVIPCSTGENCVSAIAAFEPKDRSGRIVILRKNASAVSVSFQELP